MGMCRRLFLLMVLLVHIPQFICVAGLQDDCALSISACVFCCPGILASVQMFLLITCCAGRDTPMSCACRHW